MALENKNFGLEENTFEELKKNLMKGDNTLFKAIFLSQARECITHLKFKYKASHDEAYDAMIDTMINYRQRIIENKITYGNLKFLFLTMAGQHLIRLRKKNNFEDIENLSDSLLDNLDPLVNDYGENELEKLSISLNRLSENCKKIITDFYYNNISLKELSTILGISHENIRKQKERCKDKLYKYYLEQNQD